MNEVQIPCDGKWSGCELDAVMIGDKGYAYCRPCGRNRQHSLSSERVRLMTAAELKTVRAGGQIKEY